MEGWVPTRQHPSLLGQVPTEGHTGGRPWKVAGKVAWGKDDEMVEGGEMADPATHSMPFCKLFGGTQWAQLGTEVQEQGVRVSL